LKTSSGREFGFQLTFFRTGLVYKPENPSRWAIRDLYPAHFAITDVDKNQFHYFERINRGGVGWAGADQDRYRVWNEDWEARSDRSVHTLTARAAGYAIDLTLSLDKPEVINDRDGVSQKADLPDCASHYYSLSRLGAGGRIEVDGQLYDVSGLAWMDHEFGSHFLGPDEIGWNWFSLQLDDGRDLMLLQIRRSDGSIDPHSTGTLVEPDGRPIYLSLKQFSLIPQWTWLSAASGATYPVAWHLEVPGENLALDLRPAVPDQELRTTESTGIIYWEGATRVTGSSDQGQVHGSGYLEMTGYAPQELLDQLR
jgi:predicted secreted hydrolase